MLKKRFLSNVIDMLVVSLPYFIFVYVYASLDYEAYSEAFHRMMNNIMDYMEIVCLVYAVGRDAIFRDSIGKKICHLTVQKVGGGKPSVFQLIIRNITFIIGSIEAALLMFDKKRIGDRLAKTEVVGEDRRTV